MSAVTDASSSAAAEWMHRTPDRQGTLMRKLFLVLLLIMVAALACAQEEGAALYKANCANCHNYSGDGRTLAARKMVIPDLRSPEMQNRSDEDLFQHIGNGVGHKQYPHTFLHKGMTEPKLRMIVAHLRTLKGKS